MNNKRIPLIAYSDRFSARPGEKINFKVSSESKSPFKASLFKCVSADPNPEGMGIIEKSEEKFFPSKVFKSRKQNFYPGSYAISDKKFNRSFDFGFKVNINIFPKLLKTNNQTILDTNNIEIYLDQNGLICFQFIDQTIHSSISIKLNNWYKIECGYNKVAGKLFLSLSSISIKNLSKISENQKFISKKEINFSSQICIAANFKNSKAINFFNGKIENPKIYSISENYDLTKVINWKFSEKISSTQVIDKSENKLDLKLINYPTRGVTGSNWDGSEMSWKHAKEQYSAIHFHEDDIYDFEWEDDFSFLIPDDMPSGIYLMKFKCEKEEDNIPIFICPPKGQSNSNLCLIIPTFTYTVYGNHARPDYNEKWDALLKKWNAYKHNPSNYKDYGLSTYNFHSDGSGICHASNLRPLINLRSGYITFGTGKCSGLRHFQADSHLFSWLDNQKISFDVLTDIELHNEGLEVLKSYKTIMTTSHPEYHTVETLNAFHDFQNNGGNLIYLGGNGFYWKVVLHPENNKIIEIRRAEDGIRAWASEPGEYYNAFDGSYGGLWRRNGRPPQLLTGVGFSAQGKFTGSYYLRTNYSKKYDWIFEGVNDKKLGDFGFSGGGAAGFELDRADHMLGTPDNCVILASSKDHDSDFVLVPEEHLTHITNIPGKPIDSLLKADMVYYELPNGAKVFSTGSITFCGSLPHNNFQNNISTILNNVLTQFL